MSIVEITGNYRITVQLLGSGYAAAMLVDVTDDIGTYTDIQDTGIGRYRKREQAVIEAKDWSRDEEIPYID
jgi:hypothetical protein